jgi:hypothetical protein
MFGMFESYPQARDYLLVQGLATYSQESDEVELTERGSQVLTLLLTCAPDRLAPLVTQFLKSIATSQFHEAFLALANQLEEE